MKGICHLCNEEKLLVESHIIPEGFYKNIYDDKHRAWYASKFRNTKKIMQKGYREYLLCKNCDGEIIGKYDKYAIEVIRDKKHIKETDYINALKWDGLDYELFKLFHLSVLWRAHISTETTRAVNLNTEETNEIKKYILSGTAPDELNYPIIGMSLVDPINNIECDEIITFGNRYHCIGLTSAETYIFVFGGFAWHYIISNAQLSETTKSNILRNSTSFRLQKENIREYKPIIDLLPSIGLVPENKRKSKPQK